MKIVIDGIKAYFTQIVTTKRGLALKKQNKINKQKQLAVQVLKSVDNTFCYVNNC